MHAYVFVYLESKEPVHIDDDRTYEWKSSHNYFAIDTRQIFEKDKKDSAVFNEIGDFTSTFMTEYFGGEKNNFSFCPIPM